MQRKLLVVSLLVAAAGFIAQMVSGVTDTPAIPPGLVAIVVAAALAAFTSWWWWAPLAGVAAGVSNLIGVVVVGAVDRLIEPTSPCLRWRMAYGPWPNRLVRDQGSGVL